MQEMGRKTKLEKGKKIKFLMISMVMFLIFLMAVLISYNKIWKEKVNSPWAVMKIENSPTYLGDKDTVELQNGKVISQRIQMASNNLTGMALKFVNVNKKAVGNIAIELYDSKNKMVENWNLDCSILQSDGYCNIQLKKDKKVKVGEKFKIVIKPELQNEEGLSLELASASAVTGSVKVTGVKNKPLSLAYKLYDGGGNVLKYFIIAIVIAAFCGIIAGFFMMKDGKIAGAFVAITFFIGCIYIFVLPPFAIPDESSHIVTAYTKSSKLLGKEIVDEKGEAVADPNMGLYFTREEYPTKDSYIRYIKGALGKNTNIITSKESMGTPLNMKAIGYFPQILGISIVRILGGSGEQLLLIGRLFALLWYCFIMYFAVKIFPLNKMIIFTVGLLPMTMQQVCSFSYDSVMLGLCFLLISYIMWLIYTKDKVDIKDVIILSGITVGIITIKYIYIPIIGLLIFIPKEKVKFKFNRKKAILSALGLFASFEVFSKITLITKAAESNMQMRADGLYQYSISYVIRNLGDTMIVAVRTIIENSSFYLNTMIGNPLGWVEISIPNIIVTGFVIVLIFSAVPNRKSAVVSKKIMTALIAIVVLVSAMVFGALLITYTYVGSDTILGVQGRYFLPVLPLGLLAVQGNRKIVARRSIEAELILAIIGLQLYTIWSILSVVASR